MCNYTDSNVLFMQTRLQKKSWRSNTGLRLKTTDIILIFPINGKVFIPLCQWYDENKKNLVSLSEFKKENALWAFKTILSSSLQKIIRGRWIFIPYLCLNKWESNMNSEASNMIKIKTSKTLHPLILLEIISLYPWETTHLTLPKTDSWKGDSLLTDG